MAGGWFDRTFTLGLTPDAAAALFERLRSTPPRLEAAVRGLSPALLTHRPDGRWSIQENVGHLLDLEGLWDQRLDDFDAGAPVLHAADLENRRTHEAQHNDHPIGTVLAAFREARTRILDRLDRMDRRALSRTSLHPRLQQSMSVVDLCFFVAEHDDHHLTTIARIAASFASAPDYALELLNIVDRLTPMLLEVPDERNSARPGPGKWSAREIVGHLVDSVSNNHQRFVRAMFSSDLVFPGYAQDAWVAAQRYQAAPWSDLVTLWASFNRHLARVMIAVPGATRMRSHTRHNLHEVAWRPVPADQPATLDYFMADYVQHLQHHGRQISALTGLESVGAGVLGSGSVRP